MKTFIKVDFMFIVVNNDKQVNNREVSTNHLLVLLFFFSFVKN